ncbi:MAG: hypothetical protein KatS3mg131_3115 [Candidatus Tectimicrobiota bacterium]|nr:MAG: hypothetical protein KatS3mg131_3115 [Candidatus Tectomicrobia bacterium]
MTRCRRMPMFWLGLLLGCILFLAGLPARATHQVDHRFTVYGTVRNGATFPGTPLAGKEVVVRDAASGQVLQRGITDAQGRFALVLHVHNEDLGRQVVVQSDGAQQTLTLQFDPADTTTERRGRVDLVIFPR